MSDTLRPHGQKHTSGSLSFIISQSMLKFMSIELVMPSNHFILSCPLLLPSIFCNIRVFSSESPFCIRWPKHWSFSFSIGYSNEFQGRFPLGLNILISFQSRGLSRVCSSPQLKSINFLALSLLYSLTLTSIHDYWKNRSLDKIDFCWQSNVSAF